jgi:putative ABC transport system permease protein
MIRIALAMLLGDRVKYAGVVFGIALASFLITQLLSLFFGMMTRTYAMIGDMGQADLWVTDPAVEYVDEITAMPDTALQRVRSVEGVAWAVPVYSGTLRVRLEGGRFRAVQLIGLDDATLMGGPPVMLAGSLDDLRAVDAVIIDKDAVNDLLSMPVEPVAPGELQLAGERRAMRVGDEFVINDHRVVVKGIAQVTPRFLRRPTIYTTYSRAASIAPRERHRLSFVLVGVTSGKGLSEVASRIERSTGFRVRTSRQFKDDTVMYFLRNTHVVPQMGLMVMLGTVVGIAISGQLLYLFTVDNLRHYAALRAMGLGELRLLGMIAVQALFCGIVGYGIGVGVCCLAGGLLQNVQLPFLLLWQSLVAVGAVVLVICIVGATAAMRKVLRTEPALVFQA